MNSFYAKAFIGVRELNKGKKFKIQKCSMFLLNPLNGLIFIGMNAICPLPEPADILMNLIQI